MFAQRCEHVQHSEMRNAVGIIRLMRRKIYKENVGAGHRVTPRLYDLNETGTRTPRLGCAGETTTRSGGRDGASPDTL